MMSYIIEKIRLILQDPRVDAAKLRRRGVLGVDLQRVVLHRRAHVEERLQVDEVDDGDRQQEHHLAAVRVEGLKKKRLCRLLTCLEALMAALSAVGGRKESVKITRSNFRR